MDFNKGIRARLFFFFIVMGAIPFLILVVVSAIDSVSELETSAKQNSLLACSEIQLSRSTSHH